MAGSLNSSEEMQGMSAMMGSKEAVNSKSSSFHLPKISKREVETDQQSQLQEGNELMQQARLKLGFEYCHGVVFVFFWCVSKWSSAASSVHLGKARLETLG